MTHTLDATRLMCPMPVIKLSQKIGDLSVGDKIEILATDPVLNMTFQLGAEFMDIKFLALKNETKRLFS